MVALPIVQDLIVTLLALIAVALVLRRVFGFVRPGGTSACTTCASSKGACAPAATPPASSAVPMRFLSKDGTVATRLGIQPAQKRSV